MSSYSLKGVSLNVQWSMLSLLRAQVQSLVKELRSYKLQSEDKRRKVEHITGSVL